MSDPHADCLFCRIVAGEIPATIVHEDEHTVSFMDINPTTRGHVLVVPRRHSTDLVEIDPEDLAVTMRAVQLVAAKAMRGLGAAGVNVINNCGRASGQLVFHFHVHVVPRYPGDGFRHPLGAGPGDQEEIAAAAEALRSA